MLVSKKLCQGLKGKASQLPKMAPGLKTLPLTMHCPQMETPGPWSPARGFDLGVSVLSPDCAEKEGAGMISDIPVDACVFVMRLERNKSEGRHRAEGRLACCGARSVRHVQI